MIQPRRTLGRGGLLVALSALGLVAAGCGAPDDAAQSPAPAEESAGTKGADPAVEGAEEGPLGGSILDDPTRPEEERAEDEGRKALQVYEFLGVEPGMTLADVWPGAGYNTHLLSRIAGDEGTVYAVMGFYAAGQFATLDALQERIREADLDNVEIVESLTEVPDDSVDVTVAVRNYHDADQFEESREFAAEQLHRMVRPGGVLGIVEVATDRSGWDDEAHRLNQQVVVDELTAAGFELEAESDLLANPEDDHTTSGFDAGRHTMDRYLLKFRKPTG